MGRKRWVVAASVAALACSAAWVPPQAARAAPPPTVTLTALTPTSIVDVRGSHTGAVGALATRDQSGRADDPARFVRLRGDGASYTGYRTYVLPGGVPASSVTTIALAANARGPIARRDRWTWSIRDVANGGWVRLGTQAHCGGDAGTSGWPCDDLDRRPWKYVRYNAIHAAGRTLADFVDPSTDEIRIRLRSSAPGAVRLDWESVEVYSHAGAPAPPCG